MKSVLVYIIAARMFGSSASYFVVAVYGESIESSEAHGLQLVEGQEGETTESAHNENQEKTVEIQNESSESSEQRLQEEEALEKNSNESKHLELKGTQETLHQETSENQRRVLGLPLSIIAGIGYVAIGLWMILDRRNSKIPYIIAIVGSLVLGIYFTSRTVGFLV